MALNSSSPLSRPVGKLFCKGECWISLPYFNWSAGQIFLLMSVGIDVCFH